jgi:hypothetical protein
VAECASGTGVLEAAISKAQRAHVIREAFLLECYTISWLLIEVAVAIAAGLVARSLRCLPSALTV